MDIEKFNNFIESINEAYDNPVKINWILNTNNEFDGEFYVNNVKYLIECSDWDNNIWSYKFSRIEGDEKIMSLVNDSLNKMTVLATIRIGMIEFIKEKNPSGIIINVIDGSRGRDYMWRRYSMEISETYNYELYNQNIMGRSTFFLYKEDEVSFEDMSKSFNKMLKLFQNQ